MSTGSSTHLQAAGKTLSKKNEERLRTAYMHISEVLLDAGVIDASNLAELENSKLEDDEDDPEDISAAAAPFVRQVKLANWDSELRTTLRFFGERYEMFHACSDEQLTRLVGDEERSAAIVSLRDDLEALLLELSNKHPGPSEDSDYYYSPYLEMAAKEPAVQAEQREAREVNAASDFITRVKRANWHERLETTLSFFYSRYELLHVCSDEDLIKYLGEKDVDRAAAIAELRSDLLMLLVELSNDHPGPIESGDYYPGYFCLSVKAEQRTAVKVNAAAGEVVISFDSSVAQIQAYATPEGTNNRTFEGTLFRIDEPSEGIPSVGPNLPLYVPRSVAEAALRDVSGLPLDAHSSLSQHSNPDIVGVMMAARIVDNDFRVKGYLFDWNVPDKVEAITASRDDLGMSMNATAVGHETEVNGIKVFWIDSLTLKGGNILYAERATYKKTRVFSASEPDRQPGEQSPIAASQQDSSTVEEAALQVAALNTSVLGLLTQFT